MHVAEFSSHLQDASIALGAIVISIDIGEMQKVILRCRFSTQCIKAKPDVGVADLSYKCLIGITDRFRVKH